LSNSSSRAVSINTGAFDPVALGQPHVEDDEVGRLGRRILEALGSRSRDVDVVTLLLKGELDPARNGRFVFDDQDGRGHGAAMIARTGRVVRSGPHERDHAARGRPPRGAATDPRTR
jgi:hypothetical protein